jgi:hypothetical protein
VCDVRAKSLPSVMLMPCAVTRRVCEFSFAKVGGGVELAFMLGGWRYLWIRACG